MRVYVCMCVVIIDIECRSCLYSSRHLIRTESMFSFIRGAINRRKSIHERCLCNGHARTVCTYSHGSAWIQERKYSKHSWRKSVIINYTQDEHINIRRKCNRSRTTPSTQNMPVFDMSARTSANTIHRCLKLTPSVVRQRIYK